MNDGEKSYDAKLRHHMSCTFILRKPQTTNHTFVVKKMTRKLKFREPYSRRKSNRDLSCLISNPQIMQTCHEVLDLDVLNHPSK